MTAEQNELITLNMQIRALQKRLNSLKDKRDILLAGNHESFVDAMARGYEEMGEINRSLAQ